MPRLLPSSKPSSMPCLMPSLVPLSWPSLMPSLKPLPQQLDAIIRAQVNDIFAAKLNAII
eukprot:12457549-Ditylum_brightwellii.AAC.1